jgi:diguanylate cyclase (GGDEF)-like protein
MSNAHIPAPLPNLAERVRAELIRSLYLHRSSLYFGFVAQMVAAVVTFWETQDRAFMFFGLIHIVVIVARSLDWRHYLRHEYEPQGATPEAINRLENRYIFGSAAAGLSIGVPAAYAMFFYPGSAAAIISYGLMASSMISVTGRNYGSAKNVTIITLCCGGPFMFAALINKVTYLQMTAPLMIAVMISARQMAGNVRKTLEEYVEVRYRLKSMVDQFDAALNNMPGGLVMITAEGRISVINQMAHNILGIPLSFDFEGRRIESLIRYGVRRKKNEWTPIQRDLFNDQIKKLLDGRSRRELVCFEGGTALEFSINHSQKVSGIEGGSVLVFEDVSSRIEAQERVNFLAHHDVMTSLANRGHMADLLEKAVKGMKEDERIAFCLFDVDKFKQINDTRGHAAGDKVIINIAGRLKQIDDPRAVVARIGGDEFVLCFHSLSVDEDASSLLDNAFLSICAPQMVDGKVMHVRCSGGVSIHHKKAFKLEEALMKSDIALYESKKRPDVIWSLFSIRMDEEQRALQQTKTDLVRAIEMEQLVAVYQPMYTPDGMRIECCEALARWEHPTKGPIDPSVFIEMAEGMKIIGDITRQVLFTACRDCMQWPSHISVSVNLSSLDLLNDGIVEQIMQALAETGLPPHRLQVEVTESALASDTEKVAERLYRIKALGVKTALDDFGTGYSSLQFLNDLPIDKIKIDRTFVRRITEDEKALRMFRAIVNMSDEIGFEIVVEGVEGRDQLAVINRMTRGVHLVQGYIFGLPSPASQIAEMSDKLRMLPVNGVLIDEDAISLDADVPMLEEAACDMRETELGAFVYDR